MTKTWQVIKSVLNTNKTDEPIKLNINDKIITDPLNTTSEFNKYFVSIVDSFNKDLKQPSHVAFDDYLEKTPQILLILNQ